MSLANLVAISVEISIIYSCFSLEKELTKIICMNPWMILYLTINHVDSRHNCVYDLLTWDTKDILWMDDHILLWLTNP